MKESWRLQKNKLADISKKIPDSTQLSVFLIYTGNQLPDYQLTFAKMGMIIKKIYQLIDEQPEVHTQSSVYHTDKIVSMDYFSLAGK